MADNVGITTAVARIFGTTLRTDLAGGFDRAGVHARQHNRVNGEVLALQALLGPPTPVTDQLRLRAAGGTLAVPTSWPYVVLEVSPDDPGLAGSSLSLHSGGTRIDTLISGVYQVTVTMTAVVATGNRGWLVLEPAIDIDGVWSWCDNSAPMRTDGEALTIGASFAYWSPGGSGIAITVGNNGPSDQDVQLDVWVQRIF